MGKYSIFLCDEDQVYAKRLASGLQRQMKEQIFVVTSSDLREMKQEDLEPDILLTSQIPTEEWQLLHSDCQVVWLDGQESVGKQISGAEKVKVSRVNQPCGGRILKYQPVSKIARALREYLPQKSVEPTVAVSNKKQTWYGIISPCHHENVIPFACTLAQTIEEKGVLLVIFMEFSGIYHLLGVEKLCGMETFFLQLRKGRYKTSEQTSLPEVTVFDGFDLFTGISNPTIIHELTSSDMELFVKRIQSCTQYETVVWVAESMLHGIKELFFYSEAVFSIEKQDCYSQCCQKDFYEYLERLQVHNQEINVRKIDLPWGKDVEPGEHLLYQWKQSELGDVAKKCLEGVEDGTIEKSVSQKSSLSAGYDRGTG